MGPNAALILEAGFPTDGRRLDPTLLQAGLAPALILAIKPTRCVGTRARDGQEIARRQIAADFETPDGRCEIQCRSPDGLPHHPRCPQSVGLGSVAKGCIEIFTDEPRRLSSAAAADGLGFQKDGPNAGVGE